MKHVDISQDIKQNVETIKSRIINEARTYGKVPKRVPVQNEELKLPDYVVESKTKKEVCVEAQLQAKRDKKNTTSTKAKAWDLFFVISLKLERVLMKDKETGDQSFSVT